MSTPSLSVVIDGGLDGYFKGERGLRPGDPISQVLFPLVMEGVLFFPILQHKINSRHFIFHPKC